MNFTELVSPQNLQKTLQQEGLSGGGSSGQKWGDILNPPQQSPQGGDYPSQPAPEGAYGGDQSAKDYHDLMYAIGQMQPVLQKQQDLVNQKNLIYTHMYDRPLTADEQNALTPAVKRAMASGDRNQLDMEARIINDQIQNRVKGLDTAISYITDGYKADLSASQQNKQWAMGMLDKVISGGISLDALKNTYGSDMINTIYQEAGFPIPYLPDNPQVKQSLEQSAGQDGFIDPNTYANVKNQYLQANPQYNSEQFNRTYGNMLNPKDAADMGISSSGSSQGAAGTTSSGDPNIDMQDPGYFTAVVPDSGGMTQAQIDQGAQYQNTHGGSPPPGIGLSSTGPGLLKKNAIGARAGQLAQGQNVSLNPYLIGQQAKAYGQQYQYATNVQRALGAADAMLKQLIGQFQNKGVNVNDATIANKAVNEVSKQAFDSSEIRSFQAGLQEVGNEYQMVFSRGGSQGVTDSVRERVSEIFNGNISVKDLQAIADELQAQGAIAVQQAQEAEQRVQQNMNQQGGAGIQPAQGANQSDPMGILGQ